jgi:glutathione S-transferase
MKLHWSPRSPFVRKVMVVAHETGLAARIQITRSFVSATDLHAELMHDNPLNKIPTLVLDDGSILYDSVVICEYLDHVAGTQLFPKSFPERLVALRRHALGNGFLDFLLLWRGEQARPEGLRSAPHLDAFRRKAVATLDALESETDAIAATPYGIGHVAIGCALAYHDFRFGAGWRDGRPKLTQWYTAFSARPAVVATAFRDEP